MEDEPAEDEHTEQGDESLTEDLPCVRCGYNLRGLKAEGNCPECGASVGKSLDFASERILCLACMKPNHPSAAVCSGCGSPVHTAGATANYFRTTAIGVRRKPDVDEETEAELARMEAKKKPKLMPRPSPAGVIMVAIVAVPLLIIGVTVSIKSFWATGDAAAGMCFMVFAVISAVLLILPWRKYVKQRHAYVAWRREYAKALNEQPATVVKPSEPAAADAGESDQHLRDQPAG